MMYGTNSITTVPHPSYARQMYQSSKLSLPVAPSTYIYSQFKHVSGTPAPEGVRGVSITKLKVLDVLIDQLAQLKKDKQVGMERPGEPSEEQLDALIEQYENDIRKAHAAHAALPYNPRPSSPSGAVFNLTA